MTSRTGTIRGLPDPMLFTIIGIAIALAVFAGAQAIFRHPAPVLAALPWYASANTSVYIISSLAVALLAFGRYRVLRDALSFWLGSAYLGWGILQVFYILSFPGPLPESGGLIAKLPNTSAWLGLNANSLLAIYLILADVAPWPQAGRRSERHWLRLVVCMSTSVIATALLSVAFEQYLPLLEQIALALRSPVGAVPPLSPSS